MAFLGQDGGDPTSKQGTVMLSHSAAGSWAVLALDQSQFLTNVTAGAGSMTELAPASDRFDKSHPRSIGVVCECNNADTGRFFQRGAGGTLLEFGINVAGTLRAVSDNITVGTLAIPGVAAGSKDYVFAWVSRANPETTGAGDAVQSWLFAWNTTDSTFDRTEFTHAVPTLGSSTATWGTYTGTITDFWHEMRAQSATEIANDWTTYSPAAPSTTAKKVLPPLPLDKASGFGDENQLHGPVPQWALRHYKHARWRTWSPLANERYSSVPTIGPTTATDHPAYRYAPGDPTHWMNIGWLVTAPVPAEASHVWVRVHVQSWVSAGASVPVGIRVVSMNRKPDGPGESLVTYQVDETFDRDDLSTGAGEWQLKEKLKLSIGQDGWTYLCPAFIFDPDEVSGNDANALIKVRALHAVPVFSTVDGAA